MSTVEAEVDSQKLKDSFLSGQGVEHALERENHSESLEVTPEHVASDPAPYEHAASRTRVSLRTRKLKKPFEFYLLGKETSDENDRNSRKICNKKSELKEKYLNRKRRKSERNHHACDSCGKTFSTKISLEKHEINQCRRFPCEECGKMFNSLVNLQEHLFSGHEAIKDSNGGESKKGVEEKEEYEYPKGKRGSGGKNYYEELKSHRKHQCSVCGKAFITMGHLSAHMDRHSGKKWTCEGCGRNFSCERSLTRHQDTFPGDHKFPCGHCDMNFFRVESILRHMEIKHPEPAEEAKLTGQLILILDEKSSETGRIFICTKCRKTFRTFEDLRGHKENVHFLENFNGEHRETEKGKESTVKNENVPRYKCEICSKKFVSLEGFEYHSKNQHVEMKEKKTKKEKWAHSSEESDLENGEKDESEKVEWFSNRENSQTPPISSAGHWSAEGKPGSHQCCICPRSFASSDGLKYHLATHTGERRYSCSQCGKKFIKKTHLFEHTATHSQVKCFRCPRCPRTFSTHSAFRKHMKHFPGPHSFPCQQCGKLFTRESKLEKHMCVDLVNVTMAPEVKALLAEDSQESTESESKFKDKLTLSESSFSASHSCYKCFKVFSSLDQLQTHQYEHIGKQQYQCRFCPANFKRADDFGAHVRSHLGSSPYMCLKCNRKFISPLTLSMHAKKYPGEHSFTCEKCRRWFPAEKSLEKHECILQNADAFACSCGKALKNWQEYQAHAGAKPYKCCSCELKYLSLVALARHIKKHTGVKPFSCEICGKSFRSKNNYLNHLKVHKKGEEIQCEHCDFKTKSRKRMDFHLFRKHDIGSNTSSTLCPVCGIIFPYMTQMEKHIETEHGTEWTVNEGRQERKTQPAVLCTLCGKLLSNKYMLANHTKKVHDSDAVKAVHEYKCEVCEEKFLSRKRLERHSEIHEGSALRICPICSRDFYFAKDLRKHIKRHDPSKPFSCPKCGKNFKVSVRLKYHSSICGKRENDADFAIDSVKTNQIEGLQSSPTEGNIYYGHIDPAEVINGGAGYPTIVVAFPVKNGFGVR